MKIMAVFSSPKKNGNTVILAKAAVQGARDRGAQVEEVFLSELNIQFCEGCMNCMRTGACPLSDDFENLRTKLYDSDGIILASPTYGLLPNARMKNFLTDRLGMFTVYTSSLGGKYFVGLSTGGAIGAGTVARNLAYTAVKGIFKRAYSSGFLGVTIGNGRIEDYPKDLTRAYALGEKLVHDIHVSKKYPLQDVLGRFVFSVFLKRLMLGNIRKNKDDLLKGVYRSLLTRGLIKKI